MPASSFFSVIWLFSGAVAVLTMFLLLGKKTDPGLSSTYKWVHRIFGAVFTLGYLLIAIAMIGKYQGNAPYLTSSITAHAYLGAALFPLLFIKHFIVRVARRYYTALPYIAMGIITIAFIVVMFTGINNIILWAKGPRVTVPSPEGPRIASAAIGRELLGLKCNRCHTQQILYRGKKSADQWRYTDTKMTGYDKALIITRDQIDNIVGYLSLD